MSMEGPAGNETRENQIEADRKNLDTETFFLRHGASQLTLEQAKELFAFPDYVNSMGRVFAGESLDAHEFEVMSKEEQRELARAIVTNPDLLKYAVRFGVTEEGAYKLIAAAGLPLREAGAKLAEVAEFLPKNEG